MSDAAAPVSLAREPIEGPRKSVEIVRDEDVLSLDLQHALEHVGSAVGVVAVVALLFSQIPRAKRVVASIGAPASAVDQGPTP